MMDYSIANAELMSALSYHFSEVAAEYVYLRRMAATDGGRIV